MKKLLLCTFCFLPLMTFGRATWLWSSDNDISEAYGMVPYNDTVFPSGLTVYGVLKATKSTFQKDIEVYGVLLADKSRFEKRVIIHGTAEFNYATVRDDIEVRADTDKAIIHARATIIYGDILFESGNGTVYLYENAEIKGRVIGGRVVRI